MTYHPPQLLCFLARLPLFHWSFQLHRPSVHRAVTTLYISALWLCFYSEQKQTLRYLGYSFGQALRATIPQNWRLIELWTDLASGAIRSYLAGESFAEPQFLLRRTSKSKTAWARSQAIWLYKLHLLHHISLRCLWKSSDHLGEYKKEEKYRVCLNQMRAAGVLNWTVILCGFEASGHVVFTVFTFQIWSNTYITNYAHHLLILGPVWTLACSWSWQKVC